MSDNEAAYRDRNKRVRRRGSPTRDRMERIRREERRREDTRRDPTKSSKDIERDKMRTKRDTDSKILAEKEKAIKHLLDSDTVVPPGTEVEAIETERLIDRGSKRNRESRRTPERHRNSPIRRRSHSRNWYSPAHRDRTPLLRSPDTRKRSLDRRRSSERRRRPSWERRTSIDRRDRRGSPRRRVEGRDLRPIRRSRSRERRRTRTPDRKRRLSRSPLRRGSSRRRSFSKSPDRRRKRSPFINEIARQFRDKGLISTGGADQFMGRSPLMSTTLHSGPPAGQHYLPMMDSTMAMGMIAPTSAPFIPFDATIPQPMGFEPAPIHPTPVEYNAAPVMYSQGALERFGQLPVPSPQPVPAPMSAEPTRYSQALKSLQRSPSPLREFSDGHYDRKRDRSPRALASHNGRLGRSDRLKTPEPPVISSSKPFEKTSLSSLLEASVSAKDSGCPVLYPGFKPEILRNCEMALRSLPEEDPRLKMSGRFFYDPTVEEPKIIKKEMTSNSLLVQRTKNKIIWDYKEEEKEKLPPKLDMFQKYTQTETFTEDNFTQTINETVDFCCQVCPGDLDPPPPVVREEKRPIMDRLDWSIRDNYDYVPKREVGDLRWSLSNSRAWNLASPSHLDREVRTRSPERGHDPRDSRTFDLSPIRSRDEFPHQSATVFSSRERDRRMSPTFRRSLEQQDEYANRSDQSRGESPSVLDESDDVEIIEDSFSRDSWRGRGKSFVQSKARSSRGKFSTGGRSYRGRGSGFRGKF
ncbi:serine/arginine repetitive matrix protein 1-like isoform X2 [Diachasmimorpha longicaudata]|uniref:serine/arginine repetitive matrix protein 1-like isoform X2 n=1 Tax=Diachasmimorpha longicaudata TaxID=58733 RepID=UPI0030B90B9C